MTRPCTPILSVTVRGGLSNQRECFVNAGIAASQLGVTLALPRFDLIGSGNEKFEPEDAQYVAPYADRDRWGHFNHLFNASRAMKRLEGRLNVIPRVRVGGGERPATVVMPSVEKVVPDCAGRPRVHGTCEAQPGDTTLLVNLLRSWAKVITDRCGGYLVPKAEQASQLSASSLSQWSKSPPLVFDAGKSLCWNSYKSRFADLCKSQYTACGDMLQATTWNRVISRLHARVIRGISKRVGSALRRNGSTTTWAAVHIRAFVCRRNGRKPAFDHLRLTLRRHGFHAGVLYIVSSIPLSQAQQALPDYELVSKATFLGDRVMLSYPFEVCAAIDYGVAVRAPLYLGEPTGSSFDAFASEERRRSNRSGVVALDNGVCDHPLSRLTTAE